VTDPVGPARRPRPGVAVPALLAVLLAGATAGAANAESASITASVTVASVAVSVSLTVSNTSIRVGDTLKASATVSNSGTARAPKVIVALRVDATGLRIKGSDTLTITNLQPGHPKSASWSLCALQPGNYLVLARVTVDGVATDSPAVLLSVTGQRKKAC
jgi:hypothetical protein